MSGFSPGLLETTVWELNISQKWDWQTLHLRPLLCRGKNHFPQVCSTYYLEADWRLLGSPGKAPGTDMAQDTSWGTTWCQAGCYPTGPLSICSSSFLNKLKTCYTCLLLSQKINIFWDCFILFYIKNPTGVWHFMALTFLTLFQLPLIMGWKLLDQLWPHACRCGDSLWRLGIVMNMLWNSEKHGSGEVLTPMGWKDKHWLGSCRISAKANGGSPGSF